MSSILVLVAIISAYLTVTSNVVVAAITEGVSRPNTQQESTRDRQRTTPSYEGIAFCEAQRSNGPGGKLGPTTGACALGEPPEVVAGVSPCT
jgi:hypothetical protein